MITSRRHPQVVELIKLSQRKQRRRQGQFLAEGARLIGEAIKAGWQPLKLILSPPLLSKAGKDVVSSLDCPRLELDPALMALVGDVKTSQGIAALFRLPNTELSAIKGELALILDGLRDPGNAGALLRSSASVGVDGLIATTGTVDLSAPKVVRASMGGIFRTPWVTELTPRQVVEWAKAGGWRLVALEPRGGTPFHRFPYEGKLALVVGGEAAGASEEIVSACTAAITIPMPGGMESLNAAMAATLVLYRALYK